MSTQLEELRATMAEVVEKLVENTASLATVTVAINADIAQDVEVVKTMLALIEKISTLPGAVDLASDIQTAKDVLADVVVKNKAMTDAASALAADNQGVQDAIDRGNAS